MQIDSNDEHPEKACGAIRLSLPFDWNVKVERNGQGEKHNAPRIARDVKRRRNRD
jgi:hypothetical protein